MITEKANARKRIEMEEDAALREQEYEDLRDAKEAMENKEKMDLLVGKMAF